MLKHMNFEFNGRAVELLEVNGEPMIDASHLSEVLGYSTRGKLSDLIRNRWSDEFEEGPDYRLVLHNGRTPDGCTKGKTRMRLLLTELGWNLVLVKTTKPLGKALRRFLAGEVMPQIARSGQYVPGASTDEDPQLARLHRLEERQARSDERQDRMEGALVEVGVAIHKMAESIQRMADRQPPAPGLPGPTRSTPLVGINISPPVIPEGFTVKGLSNLARTDGCTAPKMKARLTKTGLFADDRWTWQGLDPVVTGSGTVRHDKIYRFRPGILSELYRREGGGSTGPLFHPQGGQ
ncbi:MAG: hypothetical protein AAGA48_28720 [Myxococcota bacterium]